MTRDRTDYPPRASVNSRRDTNVLVRERQSLENQQLTPRSDYRLKMPLNLSPRLVELTEQRRTAPSDDVATLSSWHTWLSCLLQLCMGS